MDTLKWTVHSADIIFDNDFKLTEDGDDAIAVINPQALCPIAGARAMG